jgi:hypothetical protein
MAKVKAKILCFVDNGLRQPGDTFDYEGPFNRHLEYLEGAEQPARVSDEEAPAPKLRGRKPRAEAAATE